MKTTTVWNAHPAHYWMHGHRPAEPVEFADSVGFWNISGYSEAHQILADPVTFVSDVGQFFPQGDSDDPLVKGLSEGNLLQMDGPAHRDHRRVVSRAFTPKMVADLEPRIAEIANGLVDGLVGRDEFDFVTEVAHPLPISVIAELLGVPVSDRDLFIYWADKLLESKNIYHEPNPSEDVQAASMAALREFAPMVDYLHQHTAERRRQPREDLLTVLAQADMTDSEVTHFGILLLFAGHVTTTSLLGSTIMCLDRLPDTSRKVRADRSLVPGLIEESLRFVSPVPAVFRATTVDTEIGGYPMPANQLLMIALGAVNRDPRQFANPEEFDIFRDPNPHLAFGRGAHFCLGAPLARLEGRIAMNILFDRLGELRVGTPPTFHPSPEMCGPRHLPVKQVQRGDS
ncbi:cytochrome P450 [Kibdelosporangium philippinense]|uniref:Cytochrome P450 n=1 Tax=Kibdelosporangium philippinense TaxID=211113 RepID=A0ABS8ZH38_9PSEU|nr:cytochrome P450 [Kibdelosporangium philippinense]MCE7007131.1 cytochrome P450 [Kibdelosporangium philippinense]